MKGGRAYLRRKRTDWRETGARRRPEPVVQRVARASDLLARLDRRRDPALARRVERLKARVAQADRLLATLSHKAILARGFALVTDAEGNLVRAAASVSAGMALELTFADGTAGAVATGGDEAPARPKSAPRKPASGGAPGGQGSLF